MEAVTRLHNTILHYPIRVIVCFLVIIFVFHLSLRDDHGFHPDVMVEANMAKDNIALIRDHYLQGDFANPGSHIKRDLRHYGPLFNLVSYGIQSLLGIDTNPKNHASYRSKQIVLLCFYMVGSTALAAAVFFVTQSWIWPIIAIGLLELMPVHFGYSANNVKDIPFSAFYTFGSLGIALGVYRVSQDKYWVLPAMVMGLCIALAAAMRLPGAILGLHATLLFAALAWRDNTSALRLFKAWAVTGLIACFFLWLLTPVAYPNPIAWLTNAFEYLSNHSLRVRFLTNGEWLNSRQPPWYYVPVWLAVTTPVLWLLLAVCGSIGCVSQKLPLRAQLIAAAFAMQVISLPLYAMLRGSTLYDGFRHFLFIYPALALFVTLGIHSLAMQLRGMHRRMFLVAIAAYASSIAYDMVRLHPYQHSYFSEPVRSADINTNWLVDVWTFSDKETAQWLEANLPDNTPVFVSASPGSIIAFLNRPLNIRHISQARRQVQPYYLVIFATQYHLLALWQTMPCRLQHRVTRPLGATEITFAWIYACDATQNK